MENPLVNRPHSLHRIKNDALLAFAALLLGASTASVHAAAFSDDNWIRMSGHPGVDDAVSATVMDASGNLYVAGDFTVAGDVFVNNIAKWDGTNWAALGSGIDGGVSLLAVSGHYLYAAGYFTTAGGVPANRIAKWNGTNWAALGAGLTGAYAEVVALAVSGDDVYVSGRFTNAGGNMVNHIAKWNGSSWSALGSGLNSPAYSLAVVGSDLYAGGSFTNAGGIMVNRIARWDGISWSALGSGVQGGFYGGDSHVSTLAASGNDLYVSGYFSIAGGIAVTNMARWNGSVWSNFPWPLRDEKGQHLGANVNSLLALGNDLYAAGVAETDIWGSSYYGYVVKWNGSSWSSLGPGMQGSLYDAWDPVVSAVAVSGTNIYAGGAFTMVGGSRANCLVRWNGSEWSAVISSSGYSSVSAMAASGNNVFAAGSFTRADGILSNYVGRWNGIGWSPLGSGMIYNVSALAVSGSDLYAAGNFTNVGITANIAKWNGSSWSAVGSGVGGPDGNHSVTALAVSGGDLYAAGYFTTAGGVPATNIAKWDGPIGPLWVGRVRRTGRCMRWRCREAICMREGLSQRRTGVPAITLPNGTGAVGPLSVRGWAARQAHPALCVRWQ